MKILLAVDASPASKAALDSVATRPWPAGSRVEVLANVGHLPHEVRPDEVIRILSTFLEGLS